MHHIHTVYVYDIWLCIMLLLEFISMTFSAVTLASLPKDGGGGGGRYLSCGLISGQPYQLMSWKKRSRL